MSDVIMAIDCDLRRIHCFCSKCGVVCTSEKNVDAIANHSMYHSPEGDEKDYPKILFEIASPVSTQRQNMGSSAPIYQLAKWIIYNVAIATQVYERVEESLLVSPSNRWTNGYDVKTRHALAKATAKNKDLRECESMIWFYKHAPDKWVPYTKYLEEL